MELLNINLKDKTTAQKGSIDLYEFESTFYHRITIPLAPFDSGFEYVEQPEHTNIVLEWYDLKLKNPFDVDGLNLSMSNYKDAEGTVYVGCAHN